ncbi:MAG: hypothetical protein ACI9WU_002144 [Myxococcota bacterium]|jgi:hypothetical protein
MSVNGPAGAAAVLAWVRFRDEVLQTSSFLSGAEFADERGWLSDEERDRLQRERAAWPTTIRALRDRTRAVRREHRAALLRWLDKEIAYTAHSADYRSPWSDSEGSWVCVGFQHAPGWRPVARATPTVEDGSSTPARCLGGWCRPDFLSPSGPARCCCDSPTSTATGTASWRCRRRPAKWPPGRAESSMALRRTAWSRCWPVSTDADGRSSRPRPALPRRRRSRKPCDKRWLRRSIGAQTTDSIPPWFSPSISIFAPTP